MDDQQKLRNTSLIVSRGWFKISAFWTPIAINYLASSAGILFGALVWLRTFFKTKSLHTVFWCIGTFFAALWCFLEGISYLLLSRTIFILSEYSLAVMGIFWICGLEFMAKERVGAFPLTMIVSTVVGVFLTALIDPNPIISITLSDGTPSFDTHGSFAITIMIYVIVAISAYVSFCIQTYINSPKNARFAARLIVISGMIQIFGIFIPALLRWDKTIFPGIDGINAALSAGFLAIGFALRPNLAYVLTFKVYRLSVFETESGLPLYTHVWTQSNSNLPDDLFSALIQGINSFINEVIGGNLREIIMDDKILLLKRNDEMGIACVLISNKSTRSLRTALNDFENAFSMRFKDALVEYNNLSRFRDTKLLVEEYFSFVPHE